jgi:hypothetical protein
MKKLKEIEIHFMDTVVHHEGKKNSEITYKLEDGGKFNQKLPEPHCIPSQEERENLLPGMRVLLVFQTSSGNRVGYLRWRGYSMVAGGCNA